MLVQPRPPSPLRSAPIGPVEWNTGNCIGTAGGNRVLVDGEVVHHHDARGMAVTSAGILRIAGDHHGRLPVASGSGP